MHMCFDIETIPGQSQWVRDEILADIAEQKTKITEPGNYKDPDKIAAYIAEKQSELDATAEESWRKTGLSGTLGEIICICWAFDDGVILSSYRSVDGSEEAMMRTFFDSIMEARETVRGRIPCFVGHNSRDFDLRFIYQRCVILGIKPPFRLPYEERYNNDKQFDTMQAWGGYGTRISLDRLCKALGIPGKPNDIDGSKVWDYVKAGKIDEVVEYCKGDVERVRQVHKRLTLAF